MLRFRKYDTQNAYECVVRAEAARGGEVAEKFRGARRQYNAEYIGQVKQSASEVMCKKRNAK